MRKDSGRRWLIAAVALFLLLLGGWVVLALQLTTALAGPLPFGPRLMSNLRADYSGDRGGRPVGLISLSILEDAMQALGLSDEEAQAAHDSMELAMSLPVPTATAMDFEGAAPFTATPTVTHTEFPTETPTPTPTDTRRSPTRTPKPSKTPSPTKPPVTSAATSSPGPTILPSATPSGDVTKPVVDASGAIFVPPPGNISTCVLSVSGIHITDAPGSSGISDGQVGLKYDPGGGYIFLSGMTHTGGFQADTSWDAWYSGTFTLTGFTVSYVPSGKVGLAAPLASSKHLNIYVWARDNAGNLDYYTTDFDYDVFVSCP